jgi:hypothetical protein
VALGQVFSKFFIFPLSIPFHHFSPNSCDLEDEQCLLVPAVQRLESHPIKNQSIHRIKYTKNHVLCCNYTNKFKSYLNSYMVSPYMMLQLLKIHFQPWRRKQCIPPKHLHTSVKTTQHNISESHNLVKTLIGWRTRQTHGRN